MVMPTDLPELREAIFSYVDCFSIRLIRLVCRSWYPEADQAFWGNMYNATTMGSFLRLLPEDAWKEDIVQEVPDNGGPARLRRQNFRLIRDLTPDDWTPVLRRSRFARDQTFASLENGADISARVLACPPPGGPLFPGLKILRVILLLHDVELHQQLMRLIYPSSLSVCTGMADEDTIGAHPQAFATSFPNLTQVSFMLTGGRLRNWLTSLEKSRAYNASVARALATCSRLTFASLTVESSSVVDVILEMARSRSIKRLDLTVSDMKHPRQLIFPATYTLPATATLGELGIYGLPLADARRVVDWSGPASIHTICLSGAQDDDDDSAQETFADGEDALFATLQSVHAQFLPYRSLRGLILRGTLGEPATLELDNIRIFASFPQMEYFSLRHEFREIALDDEDCATIAGWWPNLRLFNIGASRHPQDYLPSCTLDALLAFVMRCPQFSGFQMPLDATEIPQIEVDSKGRPLRYWSLSNLAVGDSPIGDGTDLSAYLSTVFPGLRHVDFRFPEPLDEDTERYAEEWDRVKMIVTGRSASDPPEPIYL
ncbi:hypothetical protein GGF50DRAFT_115378 [Schizophyllum commune]